ncbi:hypothetical protein MATL_G00064860 [Megalops atlanticus]|uniref:Iporin n=1 Tax=Megalops atlanticus TaxID=7932 RepID=A0A9D3THR0_MEGAT|nr:hypothetical protein MATL_G00064860 [Megalops atlanticus]
MDSPPKLSGETLIVHHIPLVHCQVPGRQCCGSVKRPNPFCPPDALGLTRTASLPEPDALRKEELVYSSLVQTSSSSCSSSGAGEVGGGGGAAGGGAGRGGGSVASDNSSSFTSNASEDPPVPPPPKSRDKSNPLRHNPFLLNSEEEEDSEDREDDGDNLNGYLEDLSFHLHGNSNGTLVQGAGVSPFQLHHHGGAPEPFLLHDSLVQAWGAGGRMVTEGQEGVPGTTARLECLGLPGLESQRRHGSSGSTLSMDCGEQDWGEEEDDEDQPMSNARSSQACSCCSSSELAPPLSRPCCCGLSEPFSDGQPGYTSDSSCNSSDGVLVNFSAIYNKMNNAVPAKPPNLNSSADQSCTSSVSEAGGAFYLDLQSSPTEPQGGGNAASLQARTANPASCGCQTPQALDANCNSYHVPCEGLSVSSDLTSCFQSQARMVMATQNYYKLVTCDLSAQSSPSPLGSSVTSCSEEHNQSSPSQPTEYYLFRQPHNEEDELSLQTEDEIEAKREESGGDGSALKVIEGQVYVNTSPLVGSCVSGCGTGGDKVRLRSRSYDRNLDKSPSPRLGSLERMLSCPVRLSEGATPCPAPPPRVTSFAEIARSKRRNGSAGAGAGGSPSQRTSAEASSQEFSPVPKLLQLGHSNSLPPMPFTRCYSQGGCDAPRGAPPKDSPGRGQHEARTKAEGGSSSSSEGRPALVRYSKEQRPTSLPIQPFTFQHQVGKPHSKPLRPLLSEYVSQMQGRAGGAPPAQEGPEGPAEERRCGRTAAPGSVRPSPLGSYSPVRQQGEPSSGACSTCSPSPDRARGGGPQPPRSLSCPLSAGLLPKEPPAAAQAAVPACCLHHGFVPAAEYSPLGHVEHAQRCGGTDGVRAPLGSCSGPRAANVHHLSPQALKWREYRRKNPLGGGSSTPLSGSLDTRRGESRLTRRNVFDFPASSSHVHSRHNGQSSKQLQHYYSDIFPDYFSLTERPPEEFCLSPDASSESLSIDLLQKKGLVKAINTAVDLIVAHFGTSRDPGVKAKLGNSSVSPNVGHLILKYLCPAIRDILQDGLRGYVLDLIIGQRRNVPWSVVEASTQLGPSTRVLHGMYSKVSQYSELTSHSMRLNAFIFGLLNLQSLEFWFNHLYNHEDIVSAHYHPWGFLPLSHGACQMLFEELLLLLQPLSLLPFHLDLLFEPGLLQRGQEHLRRKEQLCSTGQGLEQSARSTFQMMRGRSAMGAEPKREGEGLKKERGEPRQEGLRVRKEGAETKTVPQIGGRERVGPEAKEPLREGEGKVPETGVDLRRECGGAGGRGAQRVKGVGGDSGCEQDGGGTEKERVREGQAHPVDAARPRDKQAGWWYQLMQSSQVYIDNSTEGSKFVKWEKRKKPAGEVAGAHGADAGAGRRQSPPPPREGVVEGAESSQEGVGLKEGSGGSSSSSSSGSDSSCTAKGRPSWMGSPPESVLNELKKSREKDGEVKEAAPGVQEEGPSQGLRWSRLFGAGVGAPIRTEKAEQRLAKSQKNRLPSGWLSLDKSVLDLVAQTVGAGKRPDTPPPPPPPPHQPLPTAQQPEALAAKQHPPREVRALCHHIATEPGQLSFNKGDVLRVLSRAEPDWLLCAQGDSTGLVPIIYVTLTEEPEEPQGPC